MTTREEVYAQLDEAVQKLIEQVPAMPSFTEGEKILTINLIDKVFRPYVKLIRDAEMDSMDQDEVFDCVMRCFGSCVTELAVRCVPLDEPADAEKFYRDAARMLSDQMYTGQINLWRNKKDTVQ